MKTLIVIPARYGSTRLPGKPLMLIAGKSLLQHMIDIARKAALDDAEVRVLVATDDDRIMEHARACGVECVMTPETCPTGTDRVREAVRLSGAQAELILNLQGDAPFTPPDFVAALIDSYRKEPCDVVTPVVQLSWQELDRLRDNKKTTPFSGTLAVFNEETGLAHWFSKNILPAIRKEDKLRQESPLSPVWRHIGLYGYQKNMLDAYVGLPEGRFEKLEGLEQLRVLEHGYKIRCVPVSYQGRPAMTGIDSPEDLDRAQALLS
ncbi:MAG: 3-deoxy-manno-octulosonate cytidylyltransferase [Bdellovibrionales bacterium]